MVLIPMVFCSQCGHNLKGDMQFCPNCGAPVAKDAMRPLTPPTATSVSSNPDEIISENKQSESKPINSSIPLMEGETILWHRGSTRGLLHKEVTSEDAVTNKRCLKYDAERKQVVAQISINHRPDVVVMNAHRTNDSLGGGVFLTPRMFGLPSGFGVYGGPRRGNIKVFGDVSIMNQANVVMTFENVQSPQGLRFLIEALKREQGLAGQKFPGQPYRQRLRPQ